MQKRIGFGQKIGLTLVRGAKAMKRIAGIEDKAHALEMAGEFKAEIIGADGTVKAVHRFKNGVTNVGLVKILNVMFDADTQITAWYLGLISSVSYTGLAATDTMASHGGWTEAGPTNAPNYDESTRPQWNPAAATTSTIYSVNSTTVDFTINATGTVKGIFLASDSTKDGTGGTLWATGLFPGGDQAVVATDVLKITYTVNAAAA